MGKKSDSPLAKYQELLMKARPDSPRETCQFPLLAGWAVHRPPHHPKNVCQRKAKNDSDHSKIWLFTELYTEVAFSSSDFASLITL